MSNYYNLDGIKTELNKRLSYEKSILKAWENVTFPTKKDGTPFKVMSKNFDGAKLYLDNFAWHDYEKRLKVNTFDDLNGYISEDINCYNQVKYISDKSKLEIKEDIKKTINRHKENIMSLEKQIVQAEKAYNDFVADYKKAIENLIETCGANDNSLFYAVRDTVKTRYPYC